MPVKSRLSHNGFWKILPRFSHYFFILCCYLPTTLPYFALYSADVEGRVTGFIQNDMSTYMANAREHFDEGEFRLFYTNPNNIEEAHIYFQPHTLILGIIQFATGGDPDLVLNVFGLIAGLLCVGLAYKVLFLVVQKTEKYWIDIVFVCFLWGGGLLSISSLIWMISQSYQADSYISWVTHFDPGSGFWMLNFGRNLLYPTESFYHLLFFGTLYTALLKKWKWTAVLLLLLALSHPFTGLQVNLAFMLWFLLRKVYLRDEQIPKRMLHLSIIFMIGIVGYYLVFLNLFPTHRAVFDQWSLDWSIKAKHFIPAYCLVVGLMFIRIRKPRKLINFLDSSSNQLFIIIAFVSFLLANHEFFISPKQPAHFTHGYVWIPLFLLGSKSLVAIFRLVAQKLYWKHWITFLICLILCGDNLLFIPSLTLDNLKRPSYITHDRQLVYDWFNQKEDLGSGIILTQDKSLCKEIPVYTTMKSYIAHPYNTSHYEEKAAAVQKVFTLGQIPMKLTNSNFWVISSSSSKPFQNVKLKKEGQLGRYVLWYYQFTSR